MSEYNCFLHPRCKGSALDERCQACRRAFSFPRDNLPNDIGGYSVKGYLGRGFYSAVYKVEHPLTKLSMAMKLTPTQTYDAPDADDPSIGGYAHKRFEDEWKVHSLLQDLPAIVSLIDVGEDLPVDFGGTEINCHWMRMAFADGESLDDVISSGSCTPPAAAQIALDLLGLVEEMRKRGINHNDLHGGNAVVEILSESRARRGAIHPYLALRVFDLGSASEESKSWHGSKPRFNDLEWIGTHIHSLVDSYEALNATTMEQRDLRLSTQLRRVASVYCGIDHVRPSRPADMVAAIEAVWNFSSQPSQQPLVLEFMSQYYNALMLPAHFAPELLHDPDGRWASRLVSPGPQLVVGMRGCGKTLLLRSLQWSAHARRRTSETDEKFIARLQDAPLGLFVSCASLLRTPRTNVTDAPLHRLFLSFALEAVLAVSAVEFDQSGEVRTSALDDFGRLLIETLPWFELPENTRDLLALERSIQTALHKSPPQGSPAINPQTTFERLAEIVQGLVDIWSTKTVLFLLDDVSTRFLPVGEVEELLSKFCLKSSIYGFKISTESQTLALTTPGGAFAREGRDYKMFDLGREVLANLGGAKGVQFLEGVLSRRQSLSSAGDRRTPSEILGMQPLSQIAMTIRREASFDRSVKSVRKGPVYWGVQALAGMCVGDIGDVVQMYELMLDRAGGKEVTKQIQHQVALDFSEQRILNLAGRDSWLHAHAASFAGASNRELMGSGDRLRQYAQVFVRIPPENPQLFERLVKLVDEGVFVFVGGTPRYRHGSDSPKLFFKVAFRKVLGLSFRIPLSMRDRFEPNGSDIESWLENPSPNKLQPRAETLTDNDISQSQDPIISDDDLIEADVAFLASEDFDEGGEQNPSLKTGRAPAHPQPTLFDESPIAVAPKEAISKPRLLHSVACEEVPLNPSSLDWESAVVIAAAGFEDRSVGAWKTLGGLLASKGKPTVRLLRYANDLDSDEVLATLDGEGFEWSELSADQSDVARLVDSTTGRIVIDTTSLTKALIYETVRCALAKDEEVWVLHTCADRYEPSNERLLESVALLDQRDWLGGLAALNTAIEGEKGPFVTEPIGPQLVDPTQPSLLVAFVGLKQERLLAILNSVPVERVVPVASLHSAGELDIRGQAMSHVARYLAASYQSEIATVGSLDAQATFELLSQLHVDHSLNGPFNFQATLTGTKLQAVGVGMFASTATPTAVYYSRPERFVAESFTHGTGVTRLFRIRRLRLDSHR
jgi:serine/threonine protein kinase